MSHVVCTSLLAAPRATASVSGDGTRDESARLGLSWVRYIGLGALRCDDFVLVPVSALVCWSRYVAVMPDTASAG